jgi:hypothetical protein
MPTSVTCVLKSTNMGTTEPIEIILGGGWEKSCKNQHTQNYSFTCCFVWVRKLDLLP